ncbi:IgGFc-binding protein-like isoform X1 [Alligator sinensis]|uniref:IgGFc-binding protein-like isoform X1 n=1 Tax=Alligator sinensis TaxID=38654 RepID=A0A1U7ST94_ALLSI|nr:IgGFc-binding protein-like isoform X1 [Alligator sinensis]
MQNGLHQTLNSDFKLFITGHSPAAAIAISMKSPGLRIAAQVRLAQTIHVKIPPQAEMVGSKSFENAVVVRADGDISMFAVNEKPDSVDATVIYPVSSLGTEYYVVTPTVGTDRYGEFVVVAWDEPTSVDIHLKGAVTFEGRMHPRNSMLTLHLQAFQAAQLQSPVDISGTRIVAQKPVAVYSGHTCVTRYVHCDHVAEQLLPVSSWGTRFIVPPLPFETQSDIVYISTSQKTLVESQHGGLRSHRGLPGGRATLYGIQASTALSLSANAGIQVTFFCDGGVKGSVAYDPFFMAIPDISSYCQSYHIFGQENFENYALFMVRTAETAGLMLDKRPLRNLPWKPVPGTEYSWADYNLGRKFSIHNVEHATSPFGLLSVGIANQKAYGAPAICATDPCQGLKCREKETCRLQNGKAVCIHNYMGTCLGSLSRQYHTFDGLTLDLPDGCTYTVAKYCGKDTTLVPFAIQEKNGKNHNGSTLGLSQIYVYGHKISIDKGARGVVRVNDQVIPLPATMEGGKLQLSQGDGRIVLRADFGLQVTYDGDWTMIATVPSSYFGSTCGLCGNFNGDVEDDAAYANDTRALSGGAWMGSWKVEDGDPACEECQGLCELCQPTQRQLFGDEEHCGLLQLPEGPFRDCHTATDPTGPFDTCLTKLCLASGEQQMLCQELEKYAATCRHHGATIGDWRTLSGCALSCPKNSHYEACGTACPATCSDPAAASSCQKPCENSCQCDPGYVLHARHCIPEESCGCSHDGHHYKPREEFWADKNCRTRCRCDPVLGSVTCKESSCKAHEKCTMVNGVRSCKANTFSTCIGTGDPHYTTFDGRRYDFQGSCIYQFASLCSQDPALVPFTVMVENNHRGKRAVSYTKTVTLEVYGITFTLSQEHPRKVKVDGVFVELPFSHQDKLKAYISGVHGFIKTNFDMRVSFDWYSYARVILPTTYANAVCGLCGNANGNPDDDFTMKNGSQASDEVQFANSWQVGEVPGCLAGCTGDCSVCTEAEKIPYKGDKYCGVLTRKDGPFQACHGVLDPAPFFEDCVFDTCLYKGHRDTLCSIIGAYVTACQTQGIQIRQWRSTTFCSPVCPRHAHYEVCGPSCPTTCRDPSAPTTCDAPCSEGCFCDAGYVLSGDQCVPADECGCVHRNRYYSRGQTFYTDTSCRERCQCQANGVVTCQLATCGSGEECRVENGILGCHPVAYGKLVLSGDTHYVSFDGWAFDIQGSCAYMLAKVCGKQPHLANFSVVVENDQAGPGARTLTRTVVVSTYGYTITMERGRHWKAAVNGELHTLPLALNDRKIWANQEGNNIIIQAASGLRVLYDTSSYVLVTVPSTYQGHVCGLGGNFNGDESDDFLLPNGKMAKNMVNFVASWKVPTDGATCSDGCGDQCPVCDETKMAPYRAKTSCGVIRATSGPFASCHLLVTPDNYYRYCLQDMCAANGAQETLCQSLQAYMAACQVVGAEVGVWRSATFCPLACPPHSRYEACTRSCDFTCASLSVPSQCAGRCFEGCQCDDGYMFDGESCVSMEQCGCLREGRYFKAEERVITSNCSEKCSCHTSGGLVCEATSCPVGRTCALRAGGLGCMMEEGRCTLTPGAYFTTFDGASGQLLYSGTYKVAALCNEASPNWFKVVMEVSKCRKDSVLSATAIFVFFREAFITVNSNMEAQVNGLFVKLPAQVSNTVSLNESQGSITITQVSGVQVTFSPEGEVTIIARENLINKLCAPCGDFNDNVSDDLRLPSGRVVGTIAEVIDAWKARDFTGCHAYSHIRTNVEAPVYPPP